MSDSYWHYHNGIAYQKKVAYMSCTAGATTDIVAAVTGKSIAVVRAWFSAAATVGFQFVDNATPGGPAITVPAANCWSPEGSGIHFQTTAGQNLAGAAGAAAAVTGWVWYIEL